MAEYKGLINSVQKLAKVSSAGKPYESHVIYMDGLKFPLNVTFFKNKFVPVAGTHVRIVKQEAGVGGNQYASWEGYLEEADTQAPAPKQPQAAAQGSWGGRSDDTQKAIRRQWAIGQANNLLPTLISTGIIPAAKLKGKNAETILIGTLGHYAKILYDATESDELFADLEMFTGEINEGPVKAAADEPTDFPESE